MNGLSRMCLNSCAKLKRCRTKGSAPFKRISQRPCDHWVAPDIGAGVMRSTWILGSREMAVSGSGGPSTPASSRSLEAWSSATRKASAKLIGRIGTRSRTVVIVPLTTSLLSLRTSD